MKIAFFHGLESPAISDKSEYLQDNSVDAYTPAMDYTRPGLFEEVLAEVKKRDIDLLVGSSMGGWFAYCISTLTGIPTLLFNPAFHSRSMEPKVKRGSLKTKHTVVLGKADDVINPYDTLSWIKTNGVGNFQTHFENNNHRTPIGLFRKWVGKSIVNESYQVLRFDDFLNESKKPKDAPNWHDSDAPDAEGRFKELGIKDLAAWLIKTRKKDLKKISGSITQQIVFNRKKDPEYAEKMEKVRKEVYKQLGREDLLESRIHHPDQFNGTNSDGEIECEGCGWTWDIVTGGDDTYNCHKCSYDNSPEIDIDGSQEINI
jgi:hypothetical protein